MSKSKNRRRNNNLRAPAAGARQFPRPAAIVLAVAVVAAGAFWWMKWGRADAPSVVAAPVAVNATNQAGAAATATSGFEKLKGKWMRPDGGYVVEIRSVEAGGRVDAAYFNPRPINVSQAHALQDGAVTKVLIELRDANYPGSTYTLAYDAASDELKGIYYQAALQQQFEVFFVRMK
jgi:hypothetical protein